jgi:hypothetical protein
MGGREISGNFESIPLPDLEVGSNYNGPSQPAWPWKTTSFLGSSFFFFFFLLLTGRDGAGSHRSLPLPSQFGS